MLKSLFALAFFQSENLQQKNQYLISVHLLIEGN